MSMLLSGSKLRVGGSGEFLPLARAQPQLPATDSTTTGFTIITNSVLQSRYASSLGNIEFVNSSMYSNFEDGIIRVLATGTTSISTGTSSGALVVTGGVGIGRNLWVKEDIHVNNLTIGQGYSDNNNIVVIGTATVVAEALGQNNIVVGYDALTGIITASKSIAIGNNTLKNGNNITNSIAIGDGALTSLGTVNTVVMGTVFTATQTSPVTITTVDANSLISGNQVTITDVVEMVELTTQTFYVNVLSTNTFALYTDLILNIPVDGTTYTPFNTPGGDVNKLLSSNNNIAIGVDAAANLIDGQKNFFFGDKVANNLTTGSYNVYIGSDSAQFMTYGDRNISILGGNLVDGVDNQINIGSTLYYNGLGFLDINADTNLGLGQESTSTTTGALTVIGGIGATGSVYSREGQADEDYLLYTPRVFVSDTKPVGARIADLWIDETNFAYLQYVRIGTDTFWLQVGLI